MSISIGSSDPYISAMTNQANTNSAANRADRINSSVKNLSSSSTKAELEEAVKSFEQYFVEQMLKQFKESSKVFSGGTTGDGLTDYYMDFAISEVASNMIDQYGGRLTQDFVAQIQRNYGIVEPVEESVNDSEGEVDVV